MGAHEQLDVSAAHMLHPGTDPRFGECAYGIRVFSSLAGHCCGRHRALLRIGGEVLLFLAFCELLCAL